ncbi:MAG: site-specific integrase, partial [Moorella sp. (in: Bacteria)]|nr:site-specific integrase [Moorella sp. (in: firmicutes)]
TIVVEAGRDPATGKRRRIKRAFQGNKRDAEKEMARLIAEVERGTYIEPSRMTFGEYTLSWLEDYGRIKLSPTTYRRYKQIIDLRVVPWLGSVPLSKLRPLHPQQFYKRLIEEGRLDGRPGELSSGSIIYHHRIIHRILEAAYKQELVTRNVADLVELPLPDEDDDKKEDVAVL